MRLRPVVALQGFRVWGTLDSNQGPTDHEPQPQVRWSVAEPCPVSGGGASRWLVWGLVRSGAVGPVTRPLPPPASLCLRIA